MDWKKKKMNVQAFFSMQSNRVSCKFTSKQKFLRLFLSLSFLSLYNLFVLAYSLIRSRHFSSGRLCGTNPSCSCPAGAGINKPRQEAWPSTQMVPQLTPLRLDINPNNQTLQYYLPPPPFSVTERVLL